MFARRIDNIEPLSGSAPLALVVLQDESVKDQTTHALRVGGYRTFAIDSHFGNVESLDGLRAAVIVLDVRRSAPHASKLLMELSDRPTSPPVLLLTEGDEGLSMGTRFGLLSVQSDAGGPELLRLLQRTRREQRRPRPVR